MSSSSSDAGRAGYRSAAYAAALSGIGRPVPFGATGGWLLERAIRGTGRTDLMGPYPVLSCPDWSALGPAIAALKEAGRAGTETVSAPLSLTFVTDPFGAPEGDVLGRALDLCRPLHDHAVIDLAPPLAPSKHHRRKLRQAGPARIEAGPADPAMGAAFAALYAGLAAKKGIGDLRRFDDASLAAQLAVPGAHLVTAWEGGALLGADLYYLDGEVAYAHLSAYAPEGYARAVSYPMIAAACDHFAPLARWLDLGGVPAAEAGRTGGGVGHFKRGWTALTRPTWLCGAVLDPEGYAALATARAPGGTAWFPAYRAGEFG